MKRSVVQMCLATLLFGMLVGCAPVGAKSASVSTAYAVTAVLALLLAVGYCVFIKKKEIWLLLLFSSVFVVNIGYFTLSVSGNLEEALLANRIAYFGSVFLPLSMMMTILNVSGPRYPKWVPSVLFVIAIAVFFVAASPGYLDIYYKSVTFERIGGVTVLCKEYGPWHAVYLIYLLGYFFTMTSAIVLAIVKKRIESAVHAVVLLSAVFVNLAVWLLEQLVKIDFEILSVSYLISEVFLIGLYLMIENQEKLVAEMNVPPAPAEEHSTHTAVEQKNSPEYLEHCAFLRDHLHTLTPAERNIFDLYRAGKTTKEVMAELHISENTLKYHNKNIYGKLGVCSRKQLLEYAKAIDCN